MSCKLELRSDSKCVLVVNTDTVELSVVLKTPLDFAKMQIADTQGQYTDDSTLFIWNKNSIYLESQQEITSRENHTIELETAITDTNRMILANSFRDVKRLLTA